jgi:hypothetical protein
MRPGWRAVSHSQRAPRDGQHGASEQRVGPGWTPFVARRAYPANRPLLLKEDRARVAQALPARAFKLRWRWHFGDGATARGAAVRHAYRRPGTYIITVDAYLVAGTHSLWFTFDRATVHIQSAEPG